MGTKKGTTGSLGQKNRLDKFYTNNDIAKMCVDMIPDFNDFDTIIEPSAGSGNFSKISDRCIAYDIHPEDKNIIQSDWFDVDKSQFSGRTLVFGNPPFGKNGNLAMKFIQESSFADCIAFILPKSFKKESVKKRIPLNFHLTLEEDLPKNSFTLSGALYDVPCVFQVWEKRTSPRSIQEGTARSSIIEFVSKNDADFRIQRVGGNAGKASKNINVSESSNYFVKNVSNMSVDDLIALINKLTFPSINDTVGPKSLPKKELITTLEDYCSRDISTDNDA